MNAISSALTQLLALGNDNQNFRNKILASVREAIETGASEVTAARMAWQDGRTNDAARRLHSLRGSTSVMGAKQFAATSLELEAAIRKNCPKQVARLFEQAEAEMQTLATEASIWLERQNGIAN